MTLPGFSETKARDMAKLVLTKTLRIQPGESVTVETWDNTLPWANAFVLESRRLGATPVLVYNDEPTYWKSLDVAGPKRLGQVGAHEWAMLERTKAYVYFYGPSDSGREAKLPHEIQSEITAWEDKWFETANRAGVRLARLYLGRVGDASARLYGIDPGAWRTELVDATLVDPLPMHRAGLKIADKLRKGKTLEIRHPNGTELTLRLRHRDPRLDTGILPPRPSNPRSRVRGHPGLLDTNLPAGSVVVAVDEKFGEGRIVSTEPSEVHAGVLTGGSWELRDGHLVSSSYRSGSELFDRPYQAAGVQLGTPGGVGIGLNPKIHRAPMMRDQRLGTIFFSVGSNRFWGGETAGHGFYSYLLLSDAELLVDGKAIVGPAE